MTAISKKFTIKCHACEHSFQVPLLPTGASAVHVPCTSCGAMNYHYQTVYGHVVASAYSSFGKLMLSDKDTAQGKITRQEAVQRLKDNLCLIQERFRMAISELQKPQLIAVRQTKMRGSRKRTERKRRKTPALRVVRSN